MTINAHVLSHAGAGLPGELSYLEQVADSSTVVVLIHGLGQDANDYRRYLGAHPDQHGVAITLPGFEPNSTDPLPVIPLETHVRVISNFLDVIAERNPGKDLVLVGFSLGADLILRLAEAYGRVPRLIAALLLDPNVNQSTMLISSLFAEADPEDPLPAFKKLVTVAPDRAWFRDLCAYLVEIEPKDFRQIRQLSCDMLKYWQRDGYEQIGARLAAMTALTDRVHVVLSGSYAEHFSGIRESARRYGAQAVTFTLNELRHFDLIDDQVLGRELQFAGR